MIWPPATNSWRAARRRSCGGAADGAGTGDATGGSTGSVAAAAAPTGSAGTALSGDDDFDPLSESGLIGNGMAVHDRKGGRLREAAALAFGDQFPGVAGARDVKPDPVWADAFRLSARQRPKRPQRLPECRIHAIEDVYRRHAGGKVDIE